MFKYTLECTGQMPPVYLKKPSMNFKLKRDKSESKNGAARATGPKAVLFEDHKKSDLFDFEEGDIESDEQPNSKFENDPEDDIKQALNSDIDDNEENDLFT